MRRNDLAVADEGPSIRPAIFFGDFAPCARGMAGQRPIHVAGIDILGYP